MSTFIFPLIAALIVSLVSFVSILIIPFEKFKKLIPVLVVVAAGAIIGDVFLHILPHSIEEHLEHFEHGSFVWIIVGIALFYLLETVLHWHHHHETSDIQKSHQIANIALVGDCLHNLFDGLAIAVAFAVDPAVGIATTLAIMVHEIPQEIGDYAIFIHSGWSKKKALLMNFLSGLTSIIGVVIGVYLIDLWEAVEQPILFITAGGLLYIALADLIPESNNQNLKFHKKFRFVVFASFILGVLLMYGVTYLETILGLE